MTKDEILATLKSAEPQLRAKGVARAALFGSQARGEARADSDIDIMVELDPAARLGIWEYAGVITMIEDLFPVRVDVSNRDGLIDIRFNIVLVGDFLRGFDVMSFDSDLKTLYATTRALEIISEASRRLPDELKKRHPQIPWQDVRSAGNLYRHNYEDVIPALIWETATEKLPPLLALVEAELARADREGT